MKIFHSYTRIHSVELRLFWEITYTLNWVGVIIIGYISMYSKIDVKFLNSYHFRSKILRTLIYTYFYNL